MAAHKKDWRRSLRSSYVWHRWLGVVSALLVLWLALTGILLNHGSQLGLDRHNVRAPWMLRAYGISATPPASGFQVAGHWITQAGDQLFFDAKPVTELAGSLIGAVALQSFILAATPDAAALLTHEGELIESLGHNALPGIVLAVANSEQLLLFRTPTGIYASSAELLKFEPYTGSWPSHASVARPLPTDIAQGISAAGAGVKLSRERVLADLHSGRLFGRYGPWIMDLAAVSFMILALTGLWLWWRNLRSQRQKLRQRPH